MQRWHSQREEAIMLKRWKHEMELHRYDWRCPPTDAKACHCARGKGSMRKRTPYTEHHASWRSWWNESSRKRFRHQKHKAIEYELKA